MKERVGVRWPCTRVRVFSSTSMDKGAFDKAVHGGNARQCLG